MKRMMVLCFSALLVLGLISSSLVSAKDITLNFFNCCGQPERLALYESLAKDYEAMNPGIKINLVSPAVNGSNYGANTKIHIATNETPPDVLWLGGAYWIGGFQPFLMPLNDLYKTDPMISQIIPSVISGHYWNGQLLGIPYGLNSHAFFYNADRLAAAGVSMPADWTWDQAIDMSKKLTKDTNSDGTPDQYGIALSEFYHSFTQGGNFYTADMRKVAFNNPVTIKAVQMYADLINGVYGVHTPVGSGNTRDLLVNGKVAMTNRGVFEIPQVNAAANFNWDVQIYPKMVENGKTYRTSYYSSELWSIYNGTKYPEEAKKFLIYLCGKEAMTKTANIGAVIPSQPSVAVSAFLKQDKPRNIRAFTDMLEWWKMSSAHPANIAFGQTGSDIAGGRLPAISGIPELERQINLQLDEWFKNNS